MQEPSRPLLSLVIATLNDDTTIQRCIDSIKCQIYPNVELIIMDGGSTDGTVGILERNTDRIVYWESKVDTGIYNAWNKALDYVRGEWVIFLGADDFLWSDDAIERLVLHLASPQRNNTIVYCQMAMVDATGTILGIAGLPWQRIERKFRQIMGIPHPATLYHRSTFEVCGRFDESFRIAGDFEFLLRVLKSYDVLFIPDLVLTGMQFGGASSLPANSLKVLREMRIAQKKHGMKAPGIYWVGSYVKVLARLALFRLVGKNRAAMVLDLGRRFAGENPFWKRAMK